MLEKVGGLLGEVGNIVRSCHERHDGGGYCCDAFNAMTTDRPYRAALSMEEAVAELQRNAGTQFHPRVVDAVVRVVSAPVR
jgi:HD-GYP domain-containing protein (c-di-GMP phosphodiesterase class II)